MTDLLEARPPRTGARNTDRPARQAGLGRPTGDPNMLQRKRPDRPPRQGFAAAGVRELVPTYIGHPDRASTNLLIRTARQAIQEARQATSLYPEVLKVLWLLSS